MTRTRLLSTDILTAARAEALFTSPFDTGSAVSRASAEAAITTAIRRHGGSRGCATQVAGEYGDHPDAAAARMRWARRVVEGIFAARRRRPRARRF